MRARARHTDPSTSKAAASTVTQLSKLHTYVLALFHHFGDLTDHEMIHHYQLMAVTGDYPPATEQSLRSRRAELVTLGEVTATDAVAFTPHGRRATVWAATRTVIPRQRG